ncbi:hypothetical protein ACTG9Q_24065 [Actinokineospora sp. 24-640]
MGRSSAALAVLAAAASTVVWAPAAAAAACSGTTGVTVVVDFASLGGGAQVGCAPGDPSSGLRALSGAGYGYTFASRQPGLVCRVSGKPASDPCVNPSPATAYWSYWYAVRGGSWVYSSTGAGSRDPAPGTVEGWAFGAGRPPATPPPAAPRPPAPQPPPPAQPAPKPPTRTAAPPAQPAGTAEPTQRPPGQPPISGRPGTPTSTAVSSTSATATSGAPATETATGTTETTGTTSTGPVTAEIEPSAGEAAGEGSGMVSFLVGGGVVAVLAGLAIGAARRRAKADL